MSTKLLKKKDNNCIDCQYVRMWCMCVADNRHAKHFGIELAQNCGEMRDKGGICGPSARLFRKRDK